MTGDPDVETAAVALLHGMSDPLRLLAADPDDYDMEIAVLRRAVELRQVQADNLAESIAVRLARLLRGGG